MSLTRQIGLAIELGFLLFIGALVVCGIWLLSNGVRDLTTVTAMMAIPAIATLFFMLVCGLAPNNIFAGYPEDRSLPVTGSLVFLAMLFLALQLLVHGDSRLVALPKAIETAQSWASWKLMVATFMLQSLLLFLVLSRKWQAPKASV